MSSDQSGIKFEIGNRNISGKKSPNNFKLSNTNVKQPTDQRRNKNKLKYIL